MEAIAMLVGEELYPIDVGTHDDLVVHSGNFDAVHGAIAIRVDPECAVERDGDPELGERGIFHISVEEVGGGKCVDRILDRGNQVVAGFGASFTAVTWMFMVYCTALYSAPS